MRTGSIAIRVAGAAAVLVLAPATAASAGNSVRATVNPAATAPGGEVEIRVVGCRDRSGAARSAAFVADAELSARGEHGWLTGTAKVRTDAEPGTYALRVTCDLRDHRHAGSVQVEGHPHEPSHSAHPSPPPKPSHPSWPRPSHTGHGEPPDSPSPSASRPHESPVAPVRAGGGGTAVLAAPVSTVDADDAGPSTPQTVIGLVLAGVAAVAVAVRSARRRRRTGAD